MEAGLGVFCANGKEEDATDDDGDDDDEDEMDGSARSTCCMAARHGTARNCNGTQRRSSNQNGMNQSMMLRLSLCVEILNETTKK
jgi:hypothetical protein